MRSPPSPPPLPHPCLSRNRRLQRSGDRMAEGRGSSERRGGQQGLEYHWNPPLLRGAASLPLQRLWGGYPGLPLTSLVHQHGLLRSVHPIPLLSLSCRNLFNCCPHVLTLSTGRGSNSIYFAKTENNALNLPVSTLRGVSKWRLPLSAGGALVVLQAAGCMATMGRCWHGLGGAGTTF